MTPATSFVSKPSRLRDAVVLVDDVVAGAQVGEALQRAAGRRGRPRRAAAEDLRVGQQREAELAPDEAAARRRDGEQRARSGQSSPGVEHARLDAAQQGLPALGLAAVRERDDTSSSCAEQPARARSRPRTSPRAASAGRCASNENGWPCGKRIELGRARRAGARVQALVRQTCADLVGLPDEVGTPVERQRRGRRLGDRRGRLGPRRRAASTSTRSRRRSAAGIDRRLVDAGAARAG